MTVTRLFRDGHPMMETGHPDPATYLVLSATRFMDTCITGFCAANNCAQGAGEARYLEVMEAAENFAGTSEQAKRVRYAYRRYSKADAFNRDVVSQMLNLFRIAGVANLTQGECTAILDAWPAVR